MKRVALVLILVLLTLAVGPPLDALAQAIPMADFGDAPDPTYPSLLNTASTPYPGRTGPYHLDVTQEWIGEAPVSTTTVEGDAILPDGDFDDGPVEVQTMVIPGPPGAVGFVTVPIGIGASADSAIRYLNVAADLNQDGRWEAYSLGGPLTQDEWIVPNLAIFTQPGNMVKVLVPFPISPTIAHGIDIWVRATITTEALDPAIFGARGWDGSGPDQGFLRGETEDWLTTLTILPPFPRPGRRPPPPPPPGPLPPAPAPPGPQPPTKGMEKEGVPDITQADAECGPTSVANSLYYLARQHGFLGKLPGSPANPQPLIDEIKRKMQDPWTGGGVTDEEFIEGKKDVIRQLRLPIDFRWQNDDSPGAPKKPTKEFIQRELDRCEDVELGMTFTDGLGGGHWVTVVGYALYPDGSLRLKIHDPDDKKTGDAYYWVSGPNAQGYISLRDYPRANIVDIVCAESPDPVPPKNKWCYPRYGSGPNANGTYPVTVTDLVVDPGSGLKMVRALVNGVVEYEVDDLAASAYEFSFSVDLPPGGHLLEIEAWDYGENYLHKQEVFTIAEGGQVDSPPHLPAANVWTAMSMAVAMGVLALFILRRRQPGSLLS